MNAGFPRAPEPATSQGGSAVTIPDLVADLQTQLDEATEERIRAASRARYLRHAIANLEEAQARTGLPRESGEPAPEAEVSR